MHPLSLEKAVAMAQPPESLEPSQVGPTLKLGHQHPRSLLLDSKQSTLGPVPFFRTTPPRSATIRINMATRALGRKCTPNHLVSIIVTITTLELRVIQRIILCATPPAPYGHTCRGACWGRGRDTGCPSASP